MHSELDSGLDPDSWCDPGIGPGCWGREYVATFTAYLDDSGIPDEGLLSVSGYVSKAINWKRFVDQWAMMCREFEVPYIHLVDAVNPSHPTYRHLNQYRRRKMLMRAAAIISKHVLLGCTTYISTKEYDELVDAKFKTRHGSAYGAAVGATVTHLNLALRKMKGHKQGDILNVFLEDGHKNTNDALEVLHDTKKRMNPIDTDSIPNDVFFYTPDPYAGLLPLYIGDIGTGSKIGPAARPPLQAADVLAYSHLRSMRYRKDKPDLAVDVLLKIEERVEHLPPIHLTEDLLKAMVEHAEKDFESGEEFRKESHTFAHNMNKLAKLMGEEPFKFHFERPDDWDKADSDND